MKFIKFFFLLLFFCSINFYLSTNSEEYSDQTLMPTKSENIQKPVKGDRWRGFNIHGKYVLEWSNYGYIEKEFQIISELGFNYARLPLDYRTYTKEGDWYDFIEKDLKNIDKAIKWSQKYGIHISLNLHRAPGYCVHDWAGKAKWAKIPDNQLLDLWTDENAQNAFIQHWVMFAKRYKNITNEYLSFNLINEPMDVKEKVYIDIMKRSIDAIREITPNRTIVLDGVDVGRGVSDKLANLDVVLSKHSYDPEHITQYKADWIPGSNKWPVPVWPPKLFLADRLYGDNHKASGFYFPLVIKGDFKKDTKVTVHINQVSMDSTLVIKSGKSTILKKTFKQGPNEGEWKRVVYMEKWKIYQNIYDKDYSAVIKEDSSTLTFSVPKGDWMTFNKIVVDPDPEVSEDEIILEPTLSDWGIPQATFNLTSENELKVIKTAPGYENYYKINDNLDEWRKISKKKNVKVVIGEFGIFNRTPHDVTLALLEFKLKAFEDAEFGWCLWDFVGPSGFLNSDRNDVKYKYYKGYRLDQKMLKLLQKY